MRKVRLGWVVLCALTATLGCRTPSQDWNGTWKLNASKSSFQGPVITISISTDGEYRYDDGSASFTFRCDGKYLLIGKNRAQACVRTSATVLDLTRKEGEVMTNAYHWELSAGDQILTSTATAIRPSGPVVTGQMVATRISGSNNFAGQWRDTSYLQRHADMILWLDSHMLHISYPSAGQYIDAPLDGVGTVVYGPYAPEGVTYAVERVARREISILTKRRDKALTEESFQLSADGRVVTESWWAPGQPADKGVFVYEKK